MANLVGCSKKVIGMTATLVNGYSSGIFYLLYRIAPNLMLEDNKAYNNPGLLLMTNMELPKKFLNVLKSVSTTTIADRKVRKVRDRQLPGVSPIGLFKVSY